MEGARRPEKFKQGLPYYYDESYINYEEAENFFENFFKYQLFENDKLLEPEEMPELNFSCFSIGYRECISNLNYLEKRLQKLNKQQKEIQTIFDKFKITNIASPVKWDDKNLPQEMLEDLANGKMTPEEAEEYCKKYPLKNKKPSNSPKIQTIHFRSVLDQGTAKPESDFYNFHCNHNLLKPRGLIHHFTKPNSNESMFVMGQGLLDDISFKKDLTNEDGDSKEQNLEKTYKYNYLGHDLDCYCDAINDKLNLHYSNFIMGKDIHYSNPEYLSIKENEFNPNKTPNDKDWQTLNDEWDKILCARKQLKYAKKKQEQEQNITTSKL